MPEKFNTIPDPDCTPEGLLKSLKAAKATIEQLTGSKGNLGATRTYVQQEAPTAVLVGDVWVKVSDTQNTNQGDGVLQSDGVVTSIWNGSKWVTIAVAGCFYEAFLLADVSAPLGNTNLLTTPVLGGAGQVWHLEINGNCKNDSVAWTMAWGIKDQAGFICEARASHFAASYDLTYGVSKIVSMTRSGIYTAYINNLSAATGVVKSGVAYGLNLDKRQTYFRATRLS